MATEPKFTEPTSTTPKATGSETTPGSETISGVPVERRVKLTIPRDVPLIFLVGPQGVGKTAALASLVDYTKNALPGKIPSDHSVEWSAYVDVHLNVNDAYKQEASGMLTKLSEVTTYIGSTGNYFILNGKRRGKASFLFIEAPGEDYFPRMGGGKMFAPLYLANIVQSEQRKIYLFVFNPTMFKGLPAENVLREEYDKAVAKFIRTKIASNRDKFLLLYTNIKNDPLLETGRSEQETAEYAFATGGIFRQTGEAFRNSPIKDKKIIPYYSCDFLENPDDGTLSRTEAEAKYPRKLMSQLLILLRGRKWWQFW
jgi:hypothetical protein